VTSIQAINVISEKVTQKNNQDIPNLEKSMIILIVMHCLKSRLRWVTTRRRLQWAIWNDFYWCCV